MQMYKNEQSMLLESPIVGNSISTNSKKFDIFANQSYKQSFSEYQINQRQISDKNNQIMQNAIGQSQTKSQTAEGSRNFQRVNNVLLESMTQQQQDEEKTPSGSALSSKNLRDQNLLTQLSKRNDIKLIVDKPKQTQNSKSQINSQQFLTEIKNDTTKQYPAINNTSQGEQKMLSSELMRDQTQVSNKLFNNLQDFKGNSTSSMIVQSIGQIKDFAWFSDEKLTIAEYQQIISNNDNPSKSSSITQKILNGIYSLTSKSRIPQSAQKLKQSEDKNQNPILRIIKREQEQNIISVIIRDNIGQFVIGGYSKNLYVYDSQFKKQAVLENALPDDLRCAQSSKTHLFLGLWNSQILILKTSPFYQDYVQTQQIVYLDYVPTVIIPNVIIGKQQVVIIGQAEGVLSIYEENKNYYMSGQAFRELEDQKGMRTYSQIKTPQQTYITDMLQITTRSVKINSNQLISLCKLFQWKSKSIA
eukprot:403341447